MPTSTAILTPDQLLSHWQGHRRVTRRVIEAFPDEPFTQFAVGGMRPALGLATEIVQMAEPTLEGVISNTWEQRDPRPAPTTKAAVLARWDEVTALLDRRWSEIPDARFQERELAFGQWDMRMVDLLLYVIDNEIHHRGQLMTYLRALGVEPPAFYDRS